jgi:hypothetical protein
VGEGGDLSRLKGPLKYIDYLIKRREACAQRRPEDTTFKKNVADCRAIKQHLIQTQMQAL